MARPRLEIDEDTVEKLASIMCTMEEMSHILGCSVDTLERRFADVINKGRNSGKMSLRRWQWEACKKGNSALLIWMGKQHLGQKEKLESEINVEGISIKIDKDDDEL